MTYNVRNGVVRFRRAPYRFRVSKNGVSVYIRDSGRFWDTEYLAPVAEAKAARSKHRKAIKEAKQALADS